mgnify:CR=1 FL=1
MATEEIRVRGMIINGKYRQVSRFLGDVSNTSLPIPSSTKDKIYARWIGIMSRCHGKCGANRIYAKYNIKVCEEWHGIDGFYRFKEWALSSGFSPDLVIDRIDTYGDYSPDNCRWISQIENVKNRRGIRTVMFRGEETRIGELSKIFNLPYAVINSRLRMGWDIERAVSEPINKRGVRKS